MSEIVGNRGAQYAAEMMEGAVTRVTIAHERQVGFAGNGPFLVRAVSLVAAWRTRVKQRRELRGLLYQSRRNAYPPRLNAASAAMLTMSESLAAIDYILKDTGLQRHEITQEALKPFWKD